MSRYIFDALADQKAVDSGYTEAELEAIFDSLAKGVKFAGPDEIFRLALTIGLSDGDVVELSEHNTVLLETPRDELDRRVTSIREKMAAGMPLAEAIEAVVG